MSTDGERGAGRGGRSGVARTGLSASRPKAASKPERSRALRLGVMSALGVAVIGILLGALLSNGSGTPTSAPQTAPCQLLTRGEAETLLGFPVTNVNALGALKLPDGAHMCAYGPGTGSHVQAGSAQALWITTKSGSAPVVVVPSLKSARGVVDGAKTTWQWDAKIAEGFMSSAKDGVAFWVTVGGQGMSAAVGEKIAEQAVGLVLSSLT